MLNRCFGDLRLIIRLYRSAVIRHERMRARQALKMRAERGPDHPLRRLADAGRLVAVGDGR